MKTLSARRYSKPGYPTKLEIQAHPDLLRRRIPHAWRGSPEMAGAMALFMAAGTLGLKHAALGGDSPKADAWVAPVFEHGSGRGATGCIVMSPPVFLSEEEALQVIREELAKNEVELVEVDRPMQGIKIPRRYKVMETHLYGARAPDWLLDLNKKHKVIPSSEFKRVQRTVVDRKNGVPLLADGCDPKKGIAIEYISKDDQRAVRSTRGLNPRSLIISSVTSYNFKEISESVVQEMEKHGTEPVHFGTFYDPCVPLDLRTPPPQAEGAQATSEEERRAARRKHYAETRDAAKTESRRLLREQVLDFVDWLKGQGAI